MSDHALTLWVVGATVVVNAGALLHLSSTVRKLLCNIAYSDAMRDRRIDTRLRAGLSDLAWRQDSGKNQQNPS